jgi:hypothetical protein
MGMRPTQCNEKRLGPASVVYATVTLSLSSRPKRSGAEGPAVPRTPKLLWRVEAEEPRISPPRYAPVEMTNWLGNDTRVPKQNCHLDRSVA